MAEAAVTFEDGWKSNFPFVSPGLYVLMGEPKKLVQAGG